MEISLRPSNIDDKEFCRHVHHSAYRDVVTRQFGQWNEVLQDVFFDKEWSSSSLQIIELDGESVGCFSREIRPNSLTITQIALLPQFQGQGIGTRLLMEKSDEAKLLGLPVRLEVLFGNRARKLYERLGFSIIGKSETHYQMEKTNNLHSST